MLRKGSSSSAVTVDYATTQGSATAGTNYTDTHGTLSFAAGETSKNFSIPVTHQSTIDGNKALTVKLTNVTGGASNIRLDTFNVATGAQDARQVQWGLRYAF